MNKTKAFLQGLWHDYYIFEVPNDEEVVLHYAEDVGYIGPVDFTVDRNFEYGNHRVECMIDTYDGLDFLAYKVYVE